MRNRDLAAKNEQVEVRTPVLDQDGHPEINKDATERVKITYEDRSGPFKEAAETERRAAEESATAAQRGLESLGSMISALREDRILRQEGLISALPNGSFFFISFSPDQVKAASDRFAAIRGPLENVLSEIRSRSSSENSAVESAIAKDLDAQVAKALNGR